MKHIIIGTAGHIDHGKTTLIHGITGRSTDRLKEEQKRGISIDLGFTYFDLPSGQRAGIIDVPGHEKFVRNMLAGVVGIDIVLFVVAADEGMMPQSKEHLAILDILGIKKGIIVLTKTDMVDEEWIELIEADIREDVKGTFLEDSEIVRVSAVENIGIDKLVKGIDESVTSIEQRDENEVPRMPIDRSFTISGHGTIVTGTLLSGVLKIDDEVVIYPDEVKTRIRSIQVHDEDVDIAYPGQRVALNLAGIKTKEAERGSVISLANTMEKTMMLDCKIRLLKSIDKPIKNRTRVRVYIGTKEVLARVILLDRDILNPGEEAYVQLRLEEEVVAKIKDRFIVRFYSPMFTIGGGVILDSNPTKKKRFDEKVLEELKLKDSGSDVEIIRNIVKKSNKKFISLIEISSYISLKEEEILKRINKLKDEKSIYELKLTNEYYYIDKRNFELIEKEILDDLNAYHLAYPLRIGRLKEELRSKYLKGVNPKISDQVFIILEEENKILQKNAYIMLKNFKIEYNNKEWNIVEQILYELDKNEFLLSKKEEIKETIERTIDKSISFDEIFNSLIQSEKIRKLNDDLYISDKMYNLAIEKLNDYFLENNNIGVGEFRDLIGTNRKISIALLEYFDQQKVTKRSRDVRIPYSR